MYSKPEKEIVLDFSGHEVVNFFEQVDVVVKKLSPKKSKGDVAVRRRL